MKKDLSEIKKLQIQCPFCSKIAGVQLTKEIEMTQELFDYMEEYLKGWQRSHCPQLTRTKKK